MAKPQLKCQGAPAVMGAVILGPFSEVLSNLRFCCASGARLSLSLTMAGPTPFLLAAGAHLDLGGDSVIIHQERRRALSLYIPEERQQCASGVHPGSQRGDAGIALDAHVLNAWSAAYDEAAQDAELDAWRPLTADASSGTSGLASRPLPSRQRASGGVADGGVRRSRPGLGAVH